MFAFGLCLLLTLAASPALQPEGLCVSNLSDVLTAPLRRDETGRFRFRSRILALHDGTALVGDGTSGTSVPLPDGLRRTVGVGDLIALEGTFCDNELNRRSLTVDALEVIGRGTPTEPREITADRLSSGECDYSPVRVRGVVSAVIRDELDSRWNWFVLRSASGSANVAIADDAISLSRLRSLTDAEVSVSGVAAPLTNWRANRGSYLHVAEPNALCVIRTPPADLFLAPPLETPPATPAIHRQRISGTVLAASRDTLFLRTDRLTFLPVHPMDGSAPYPPGSSVDVCGFPQRTTGGLMLFDALLRASGKPSVAPDEPIAIDPKDLFTDLSGIGKISVRYNGRIVRLAGTVRSGTDGVRRNAPVVLACGAHTLAIDLSALPDTAALDLRNGCRLEAAGLCVASFHADAIRGDFPHFAGFTIVPRTADDIRILARPPWWTPFRLFICVCTLLIALVAVVAWNKMLRLHAERRGRELYREKIAHARAELKVEERTNLAVELHDSLSQTLAGVSLQIESSRRTGDIGRRAAPFLETALQMLSSCRSELQGCLWDLRSRTFEEHDMTEAIERAVRPHAGSARILVRFNIPRELLLETTTHAVLRIVRELVVNAVRHGGASEIRIAGERHDGMIRFSVADNGCGFDTQAVPGPVQGHFGLQGIRERLKPFHGLLEIESRKGTGTRVTVQMSIAELAEERNENQDTAR